MSFTIRTLTKINRYVTLLNRNICSNLLSRTLTATITSPSQRQLHLDPPLQKYIKKSQNHEADIDDDEDNEFKDERDSKVIKTTVNSLRADALLKSGLGMARNKIETIFYESKIRVNGQKLSKKSVQLHIDDEIDVIRGFSQTNTAHLVISRVVILAAEGRDDGISVTLRRYKSLLIDNYKGSNAFRSSETADH